MKKYFAPFLCLALFFSCDLSKRIDTSKAVEEMELRKVKRILPREIISEVTKYGMEIESALKNDSISLDSLRNKYAVKIYAYTIKRGEDAVKIYSGDLATLSKENLDKKLMEVIDAMDYAIENNQSIPATIQRNSSEDSLFYLFNQENLTYIIGFSKKNIILNYE